MLQGFLRDLTEVSVEVRKKVTTWIAQLGGFLARKGDGSPGITHIWRGLKKLADMMIGAQLYGHICG